ncbi:MAG: hypothetical protein R3F25_10330 [Gammaproteobacteria bacterium]
MKILQERKFPFSRVSSAEVQSVIDAARDVYGLDIGTTNAPGELDDTKENLLVKLDWIINENHRLAFKYNTNEDNNPILPDYDSDEYSLSSHWYVNHFETETYAINLYSDWSDSFNTELRLSTSQFDKTQ